MACVSARELVVLGSASQAPTRHRNHNGYLLRWDAEGILFDPGEGTQRQFTLADVSPAHVTRICVTHLHGDHCLGVPGMIMRIASSNGPLPIRITYPASGQEWFERLRSATIGQDEIPVEPQPIDGGDDGEGAVVVVADEPAFTLTAMRLRHRVDAYGYRLAETDGRHLLRERLAAAGVAGPDVGRLQRDGSIEVDGRTVRLDEVSQPRRGQVFAFVMDTAWCDAAITLAAGADLLVCESTFLEPEAELAERYGHLTAAQAGRVASEAGARRLVLTHFSARYAEPDRFADEAATTFDGEIVVAEDLMRVPVPPRA
jgi:ribonuclease Z